MNKPDEQLMQEYQSGEREAMSVIFERYKGRVLGFCLRLLGNRADAEEMASEVFLALSRSKYEYAANVKFSTWLYTIARNKCVSHLRKAKPMISLWLSKEGEHKEPLDIPDGKHIPSEEVSESERAVYVREAIGRLPLAQREAVILQQYQGLSYEAIAQVLGCSLDNVKVIIFRAKERLRGELSSLIKEGSL